ncbi:MAG: hypothetical protein K0S39_6037, partial [Paenibacillus sp.]|nr:hypothetical protein [Paenibacillus sp.]
MRGPSQNHGPRSIEAGQISGSRRKVTAADDRRCV